MIVTNLDIIVRRWLLERSIPIHYYAEGLYHAASAVRELSYDTLNVVNWANLITDDTGSVSLPDDFVDDVSLCLPTGQALAPLPKQDWITPIRIHDTTSGEFVSYTQDAQNADGAVNFFGLPTNWSYYWNVNDYGEFTGKRFGAHGGTTQGYKVIKQSRRIQLTESLINTPVTLIYIGDGQSAYNASQIDPMSIRAVHSWIDWMSSPNKSIKDSAEARTFYNEKRRLKILLNPITKADITNIIRNAYTATIKF